MDFKSFIKEEKEKHIVVAYCNMNPPSLNEEALVKEVKQCAKSLGAFHTILLQHRYDSTKNPLLPEQKLRYSQEIFPKTNFKLTSKDSPSLLHNLSNIFSENYKNITIVTEENKFDEISSLVKKYNGAQGYSYGYFNFKNIDVKSINLDLDNSGIIEAVENNTFSKFNSNMPKNISENLSKDIFSRIRKNIAIKEQRDIREQYLNGELFNLGTIVETSNGKLGEVVFRGATYITVESDNKTNKYWLKDIKEKTNYSIKSVSKPIVQESYFSVREKINKIPALLMSTEKLEEVLNSGKQVSYLGYTTSNFDICPTAFKQINELISSGNKNEKYILQAVQALDDMFGIEKQAIKRKFANEQMVHDFLMKFSIAHDTLNMLGYDDDKLDYMTSHIDTMSKLSLHRDSTFANEFGTHTPTFSGQKDIEEDIASSDFKMELSVNSKGKPFFRKIRAKRIRSSHDPLEKPNQQQDAPSNLQSVYNTDNTQDNTMKQKSFSYIKKMTEAKKMKSEDPCWDGYRQVGIKTKNGKEVPNCVPTNEELETKGDVFAGIDKEIPEHGNKDLKVGLFSFKDFASKNIPANVKDEEEMSVKSADAKAIHSPAYKTMRKAHLMDN